MLDVLIWTLVLLIGHSVTDLSFYSVHRWILHGWLGKLGPLSSLSDQHKLHHAKPLEVGGLLFTPLVNTILLILGGLLLYLSVPFGVGYITYIILYSWRHGNSHFGRRDGVSVHHMVHHLISPKFNFDIVYPMTDVMMGTYLESNGSIKKCEDENLNQGENI